MIEVLGHFVTRSGLKYRLPPAVSLVGAPSTGRKLVAQEAAELHGILQVDVLTVENFSMEDASRIGNFLGSAPVGVAKMAILDVGLPAREVVGFLLRLVEMLPDRAYVVLLFNEGATLRTDYKPLLSRTTVYQLFRLTEDDVEAILVRLGVSPGLAHVSAERGDGTVAHARKLALGLPEWKPLVLRAIAALRTRDLEILEDLEETWTREATWLLREWATEAMTNRWRLFSEAETGEGMWETARDVWSLLDGGARDDRPVVVVRSLLMPLVVS